MLIDTVPKFSTSGYVNLPSNPVGKYDISFIKNRILNISDSFPKVTQLVNGRDRIYTQICLTPIHIF